MFNLIEQEYLKTLLETYIINGDYTSYLACTIENVGEINDTYDFYVYIAKEPIEREGLSYHITGDYIYFKIDSSEASPDNTFSRVVSSVGTDKSIVVNQYEHVYSSAGDNDLIAMQQYNKMIQLQNQETDFLYMTVISSLLLLSILLKGFAAAFPIKIGSDYNV